MRGAMAAIWLDRLINLLVALGAMGAVIVLVAAFVWWIAEVSSS